MIRTQNRHYAVMMQKTFLTHPAADARQVLALTLPISMHPFFLIGGGIEHNKPSLNLANLCQIIYQDFVHFYRY